MKKIRIFQGVGISLIFVFSIIACTMNMNLNDEKGKSFSEKQEFEYVQKRFFKKRNISLFETIGWTLIHSANPKYLQNVSKQLDSLKIIWSKDLSELEKADGIRILKENIAELLESEDGVIRAFGAITLGIVGDQSYSDRIAKLLEDKQKIPSDYFEKTFMNYDRSRAAMALGLLESKAHSKKMSDLLLSDDQFDRTGAALGLGYMNAYEYADDVAKLLDDNEDQVRRATMESLAMMDAKDYARDISKLLYDELGDDIDKTACYALVKLNATEYARNISTLLEKEFIRGDAAKALALMNATQYIGDISKLLENDNSIIRCDALMALAILNAKQCREKIAKHLTDETEFVRVYAAFSLLMMDSDKYKSEIYDLLMDQATGRVILPIYENTFHPIVIEELTQIKKRAEKSFNKMKKKI